MMSDVKRISAWWCGALLLLGVVSLPRLAAAHGGPTPLDSWGNFGQAASCQRIIARATRLCFEVASRAHLGCANAKLSGVVCTPDTSAIQQRTTNMIADNCSTNDVRILGYLSVEEAQIDLTNACTQQVDAVQSLVYGPAMFSGDVAAGPEARDRCMRSVSRYAFKAARVALRERNRALDRIASTDQTMDGKQALLAAAEAKISAVRDEALAMIRTKCSDAEFTGSYGMSFDAFSARLTARADCVSAASHVVNAVGCPAPACGNAVKEPGEECDDGNSNEGDACSADCKRTSCESFASTYDLIQKAVFENKHCADPVCHGEARQGNLDLRAPQSYDELVNAASTISTLKRVEPGGSELSFLYKKLAAATLGTEVEGSPMPNGLGALSTQELEAVRLWIYNGAPRTGVIANTGTLLNACLPPADPIQIEAPPPPAAGEGVQLHMPKLDLPPQSETEVCFASYYDFTDQVPEGVTHVYPKFDTLRYKKKIETQDPLSHHLIIHSYLGQYGPEDPGWGAWTCKGGAKNGETCEPKDPNSCGPEGLCGSEPKRSVACIGFGPPDYTEVNAPAFGGTQQPLSVSKWSEGVFSEIPVKGIIVWNAHAFNTTKRPAKVEAWVNLDFAQPPEQQSPVQGGLLETQQIFIMNPGGGVPPFQRKRYCWQHTFPQGTRLFELGSHMHKHGKLFQIYEPEAGNPDGKLIYTSTQYNDPVQLDFPDKLLDSADAADRTYRYCAEYDNGFTDPAEVTLRSTSPLPPPPFPATPCTPTHCTAGKVKEKCSTGSLATRNASCDTSPGAGDGVCDACPLMGGVTTANEMFLLIAYYSCDPAFPDTCKNEYGFLSGGGGNTGGAGIPLQ